MATGVYETKKKDGSIYYRVSITFNNKHISLGSSLDKEVAAIMYSNASEIIRDKEKYLIDPDSGHNSYDDNLLISYAKFISLVNYRDNNIYIKTPIYLCKNYFWYFLDKNTTLRFSTDDLFYYSNHTIMNRGGYYFVNDYGMQTSILSRYGIRPHSVKEKDYIFKNGDINDYRYENILVINRYNGVSQIEKNGRIMYIAKIHINGEYKLGTYPSENEAAIAYNKAVDMLSGHTSVKYNTNYLEDIKPMEYATIYHNVKLSKSFRDYVSCLP